MVLTGLPRLILIILSLLHCEVLGMVTQSAREETASSASSRSWTVLLPELLESSGVDRCFTTSY